MCFLFPELRDARGGALPEPELEFFEFFGFFAATVALLLLLLLLLPPLGDDRELPRERQRARVAEAGLFVRTPSSELLRPGHHYRRFDDGKRKRRRRRKGPGGGGGGGRGGGGRSKTSVSNVGTSSTSTSSISISISTSTSSSSSGTSQRTPAAPLVRRAGAPRGGGCRRVQGVAEVEPPWPGRGPAEVERPALRVELSEPVERGVGGLRGGYCRPVGVRGDAQEVERGRRQGGFGFGFGFGFGLVLAAAGGDAAGAPLASSCSRCRLLAPAAARRSPSSPRRTLVVV